MSRRNGHIHFNRSVARLLDSTVPYSTNKNEGLVLVHRGNQPATRSLMSCRHDRTVTLYILLLRLFSHMTLWPNG